MGRWTRLARARAQGGEWVPMDPSTTPSDRPGPGSALPPVVARVLAFVAVVIAGVCGGLIGFGVVDLSCDGTCTVAAAGTGVGAALLCAGGVAVVAVLTLRAMGEWRAGGKRR